jgi:hypothetical protein
MYDPISDPPLFLNFFIIKMLHYGYMYAESMFSVQFVV